MNLNKADSWRMPEKVVNGWRLNSDVKKKPKQSSDIANFEEAKNWYSDYNKIG